MSRYAFMKPITVSHLFQQDENLFRVIWLDWRQIQSQAYARHRVYLRIVIS